MTRADIEQLLARHKRGFLERDAEALANCHTIDGTFESPAYGVVKGRDQIRDVYRYWYRAFPDLMLTWENEIIDPPRAAYFWAFEGTAEGPFFGDVRPGSRVTMTGATECVCTGQGFAAIRHVFDFSGGLLRAGVLKVKPA